MRLWTVPLRLLSILALAALASGVWLFRQQILHLVRIPANDAPVTGARAGIPDAASLARAQDKIDSLHGWAGDSVVLTVSEVAALVQNGLPRDIGRHLDSLVLTLGEQRITVSARLETAEIPAAALGPLAGALDAWERVTVEGPVVVTRPGSAEWRVDGLTLRGFTLPEEASRELIGRALPGVRGGAVPLTLPRGVSDLRIRPTGASFYREDTR
jgi:hypothetical protein